MSPLALPRQEVISPPWYYFRQTFSTWLYPGQSTFLTYDLGQKCKTGMGYIYITSDAQYASGEFFTYGAFYQTFRDSSGLIYRIRYLLVNSYSGGNAYPSGFVLWLGATEEQQPSRIIPSICVPEKNFHNEEYSVTINIPPRTTSPVVATVSLSKKYRWLVFNLGLESLNLGPDQRNTCGKWGIHEFVKDTEGYFTQVRVYAQWTVSPPTTVTFVLRLAVGGAVA